MSNMNNNTDIAEPPYADDPPIREYDAQGVYLPPEAAPGHSAFRLTDRLQFDSYAQCYRGVSIDGVVVEIEPRFLDDALADARHATWLALLANEKEAARHTVSDEQFAQWTAETEQAGAERQRQLSSATYWAHHSHTFQEVKRAPQRFTTQQVAAELGLSVRSVQALAQRRGVGERLGTPPHTVLIFSCADVEALRKRDSRGRARKAPQPPTD